MQSADSIAFPQPTILAGTLRLLVDGAIKGRAIVGNLTGLDVVVFEVNHGTRLDGFFGSGCDKLVDHLDRTPHRHFFPQTPS